MASAASAPHATHGAWPSEETGMVYLARTDNADLDNVLTPLQAAASPWRIAQGLRAWRKGLTLWDGSTERREPRQAREWCINRLGFSLHSSVHLDANARKDIEQLARYITRQAIANERLDIDVSGNAVIKLKTALRNGATHIVLTPMAFM